jgi:hypothetical protein
MGGRKGIPLNKIIGSTRKVIREKKELIEGVRGGDYNNLAGVMIGVNRKDRLYSYVSGIEKLLKKRILDVRKKTNKPDFNNYVK